MAITNYYNFYCDSNTVVCAKLPQEACFRADFFALNNSVVYFMSCAPSICATNIGSLNLQTAYKQASACLVNHQRYDQIKDDEKVPNLHEV